MQQYQKPAQWRVFLRLVDWFFRQPEIFTKRFKIND